MNTVYLLIFMILIQPIIVFQEPTALKQKSAGSVLFFYQYMSVSHAYYANSSSLFIV